MQRTRDIHLLVAQQLIQIQCIRAHGFVIARAIAHQIQRAFRQQLSGVYHSLAVCHIQHHGLAAGVLLGKALQRLLLAGRHNHTSATGIQSLRDCTLMPVEAPISHTR